MEILNISLKSSTKFGSFPRGLRPAPVPAIGVPNWKNTTFYIINVTEVVIGNALSSKKSI